MPRWLNSAIISKMESSPQRGSDGAVPVAPRSSDLLTSQRQEQTAEVDVHESLLVEAPRRAQVLLRYSKTHFKSHLLWMAFILRRHSVTRHRLYTEDNKCKWSNNYPDSATHAEELMESGEQQTAASDRWVKNRNIHGSMSEKEVGKVQWGHCYIPTFIS